MKLATDAYVVGGHGDILWVALELGTPELEKGYFCGLESHSTKLSAWSRTRHEYGCIDDHSVGWCLGSKQPYSMESDLPTWEGE